MSGPTDIILAHKAKPLADSISTNSDLSSAISSDSCASGGSQNIHNLGTSISEVLEQTKGIISRLQRLSIAIKKASKRDRSNKIANFEPKEQDDIQWRNELREHAVWLLDHFFPQSDRGLRSRLLAGIVLRQKRLLYFKNKWKQGRSQLSLPRELPPVTAPIPSIHDPVEIRVAQEISPSHSPRRSNQSAITRTQNTASAFDEKMFKPEAAPSRQPALSVRSMRQDKDLDWPAVPKRPKKDIECECPYCFDILEDEEFSDIMAWRSVNEHLALPLTSNRNI